MTDDIKQIVRLIRRVFDKLERTRRVTYRKARSKRRGRR